MLYSLYKQTGRTIVTTIHQPSSRMFYMFDKLLLISDGCPIYHGKARESMQYFTSLGFVPELAMNPAEFLLDLAAGQVNDIIIPEALRGSPNPHEFEAEVVKVIIFKDISHYMLFLLLHFLSLCLCLWICVYASGLVILPWG